jgi:2'-5' RNA ligase
MDYVRAFIAIELPDTVRALLADLQRSLMRAQNAPVKWVAPEAIHLTLKFLGNVESAKIPAIEDAANSATAGSKPFRLETANPGVFPNLRSPRVVWVGLVGDIASLLALQEQVEHALAPLGFPPEGRPFSPHLTLGRVRENASPGERRLLGEALQSLQTNQAASFEVRSISLMRSTLTRAGAMHSCLASTPLSG